ncbi:class I SAM-dependent methyltransferase [Amycolatopsis sp. FDAARGOS 1241]|uniref:class I SAM-dependent methyltransferase n=1 Tax=Amycolatopsis sp. FDAARGOS 1241 TaxID=2778070 RepID=UPI001950FE61|nr:class I SAM-dependent methyltransferase [Amycolatopsis sp. FDAARGOS 1241]QRP44569.1 class I SAM-dependent methyltransferase [Amycolatopsis sp. FDAARGOS 1241]
MSLGFSGEVTEFYHRFRRGYPPAAFDAIAEAFALGEDDVVLDLGCGTGQLAVPMAARVRAVVGMDPSPDMLARARQTAADAGVTTASWLLGSDTDVPALGSVLGGLGAVTVGQALHWMDHATLFAAVKPLLRAGGGIAVVTNGEPLWLQDSAWSQALRGVLSGWFGQPITAACGTDDASQERYRAALTAGGYATEVRVVGYTGDLTAEEIIGGVYSAMGEDQLPSAEERPVFEDRIRTAIAPHAPFTEPVRVTILTGRA